MYVKVPIADCYAKTNKATLGIRWIDINKGDEENVELRSRLVAKESTEERMKNSSLLRHR